MLHSFMLLLFTFTAHANLQVFPTRVTLSEQDKVAQLTVRHTGTATARYRISTVFYRMQEDGALEAVEKTEAGDKFAGDYFRFSPHEVELQPEVEQVVRVMLTKPADLAPGEYRAYLYFEGVEETEEPKAAPAGAKQARMQLKARMAIAIPVIVQTGEVKVETKLEHLRVTEMPDKTKGFALTMKQEGNGFAHGDFYSFFKPKDGNEIPLGQVNAVSSYLPQRTVSYGFNLLDKLPELKDGVLRVEFRAPASQGGKTLAVVSQEIKE